MGNSLGEGHAKVRGDIWVGEGKVASICRSDGQRDEGRGLVLLVYTRSCIICIVLTQHPRVEGSRCLGCEADEGPSGWLQEGGHDKQLSNSPPLDWPQVQEDVAVHCCQSVQARRILNCAVMV
jgi:hypothetical protein